MRFRTALESKSPSIPLFKRGRSFSSLWKREVGRDLLMLFQTTKLIPNANIYADNLLTLKLRT
jgi:hypothetical protein